MGAPEGVKICGWGDFILITWIGGVRFDSVSETGLPQAVNCTHW